MELLGENKMSEKTKETEKPNKQKANYLAIPVTELSFDLWRTPS